MHPRRFRALAKGPKSRALVWRDVCLVTVMRRSWLLCTVIVVCSGAGAVVQCGGAGGAPDGGSDATGSDVAANDVSNGGDAADGGAAACSDSVIATNLAAARSTIKHVIVINQENRSFDTYFGTFPGADGIPMDGGVPTVCNVDPKSHECVAPYHDMYDENYGGPHGAPAFKACVGDGGMGGFIASAMNGSKPCDAGSIDPNCQYGTSSDVMGYHTDEEIPNYWAYAKSFVLQDHMFEPVASYSLPDHLWMVSEWSASCTPANDPLGCTTDLDNPGNEKSGSPEYPWTDITYLLHQQGVSWNYYVAAGQEPDCEDGVAQCNPPPQSYLKPGFWNVLPWFDTVKADNEVGNVVDTNDFYKNVDNGKLAAVSWLIPSAALSEHPPALITRGQAYVTEIVNKVMQSQYWNSTVIFVTWDDWGGFYDHLQPVNVDANGYGIRVPGLAISPWVKPGLIDKQVLSHDSYLKFIEDVFLGGAQLDGGNGGRPDNRPTNRDAIAAQHGDLLCEFDFTQSPNASLVLSPCPTGVDTIFSEAGACQP